MSHSWNYLSSAVVHYYNQLTSCPSLRYFTEPIGKLFRFGSIVFEHYSLEKSIQNMVSSMIGHVDSLTTPLIRLLSVIYYGEDWITYKFLFNEAAGMLYYEQTLPIEWSSFKEGPTILKLLMPSAGQADSEQVGDDFDFVDFQHDILDMINTFNSAIVTRNVVPPFNAHAMITSKGIVRTFDGKLYNFRSQCSHLLISDFLHNRFSVVGHFDGNGWKHLTLVSKTRTIDIHRDMKVTINNRLVGLPQALESTLIQRIGDQVVLEQRDGLIIKCNMIYAQCSITISGWYFGKTGGLLGVYDNEPANDWMMPSREIASNVEDFVASWQVGDDDEDISIGGGSSSSCAVSSASNEIPNNPSDRKDCKYLFSSEHSALMPCFTSVDPAPFVDICNHNLGLLSNQPSKQAGLCDSAAAYIETCSVQGVELWMPTDCVTCKGGESNSLLNGGESLSYQNTAPRSADVVFLVEQQECLSRAHLSDLPHLIDLALKENQLEDNKFALIGFGGPERYTDPQVFTAGAADIFDDQEHVTASMARYFGP